jgi:hypothetical protein
MKREVAKAEPLTKEALIDAIVHFWNDILTIKLCNRNIDHVYKVAPVCILLGKATGDKPKKLFKETSEGKRFQPFQQMIIKEKIHICFLGSAFLFLLGFLFDDMPPSVKEILAILLVGVDLKFLKFLSRKLPSKLPVSMSCTY